MIQGNNRQTKNAPKCSVQEASGPDQEEPPRATRGVHTACGGRRRTVRPRWHGCASLLPPILRFSLVAFRFPTQFLVFALLNSDVSGHPIDPIPLNPPFFTFI